MKFITLGFKFLRSVWDMLVAYHREIKLGLIVLGIVIFLAIPDVIIGLMLEGAHLLFELLESGLDKLIEHTLHTDMHETQIIVFYILLAMILLVLYGLYIVVPPWYAHWKEELSVGYVRLQIHATLFWQSQSLIHKIYWVAATSLVVLGLGFLLLT